MLFQKVVAAAILSAALLQAEVLSDFEKSPVESFSGSAQKHEVVPQNSKIILADTQSIYPAGMSARGEIKHVQPVKHKKVTKKKTVKKHKKH